MPKKQHSSIRVVKIKAREQEQGTCLINTEELGFSEQRCFNPDEKQLKPNARRGELICCGCPQ